MTARPPASRGTARKKTHAKKPDLAGALARGQGGAPAQAKHGRIPMRVKWGVAAAASLVVAFFFYLLIIYPSGHGPGDGHDVEIVVDENETTESIAAKLGDKGLVASPRVFAWYVGLTGGAGSMVRGAHLLTDDATPRELVARLERRPGAGRVRVTFPEGWTRFDMAKRLQDKHICTLRAFLDATTDKELMKDLRVDAESMEGYLFPATYEVAPDSDAIDIVRRMKGEFDKRYYALAQKHDSGILDLDMSLKYGEKEIVILASMIEKEAVVDEERPIIASVFLNRLRDPAFSPRYLQCDPTASYGCLVAGEKAPSCATFAGKATAAIQHDPLNPYSTYTHEKLPPGPIANPGAKSLEAVMAPSSTHYLYFVARGEGRHTFSDNLVSHTAAVKDGGKH